MWYNYKTGINTMLLMHNKMPESKQEFFPSPKSDIINASVDFISKQRSLKPQLCCQRSEFHHKTQHIKSSVLACWQPMMYT